MSTAAKTPKKRAKAYIIAMKGHALVPSFGPADAEKVTKALADAKTALEAAGFEIAITDHFGSVEVEDAPPAQKAAE